MKLERKLWVLTLFLAFVMVIPSVALAQYNLTGIWLMKELEVANDFPDGDHKVEPQEAYKVCIYHDTGVMDPSYFNIKIYEYDEDSEECTIELIFEGGTGSYFIGFASAESDGDSQDAFTGRVSRNARFIRGKFIHSQYVTDDDQAATGINLFSMTKVSND